MSLTCGSLFSGCLGADHGLVSAGFEPLWFCEVAPRQSDVIRYHYPNRPNLGDIRHADPDSVLVPDVVWMSPPCQDLSVAGLRRGLAGDRSGLFYDAIRFVRRLTERGTSVVLMEQVPGLLSSNGGRDFACVLGAFLDIGARDVGWTLLDTQYAGVPQSRDRLFFVVDFGGERAGEILFDPARLLRNLAPRREAGQDVAPTLTASVGKQCGQDFNAGGFVVERDSSPPLSTRGRGTDDFILNGGLVCEVADALTANYGDGSPRGDGSGGLVVVNDPAACLTAAMAKTCDSSGKNDRGPQNLVIVNTPVGFDCSSTGVTNMEDCSPALRARKGVTSSDAGGCNAGVVEVASFAGDGSSRGAATPAILASQAGKIGDLTPIVVHGLRVRRFTPVECERLQGLPDDWTRYGRTASGEVYELKDTPRYAMLGNAVTATVAQGIAERVAQAIVGEASCAA